MAKKPTYEESELRVKALEKAEFDRNTAVDVLSEIEPRPRKKLDSNLLPSREADAVALNLSDIIDIQAIQSMMDDFFELTNIGIAILDLHGRVLVATGWQDICTQFHRIHPKTNKKCLESDLELSNGVEPGTFRRYRCENNMWDMATPINMGDKRVGNLYLGQFLFEGETPDLEVFRSQAKKYGFNEEKYLAALERVPRWSQQTVNTAMTFYAKLAHMISALSYSNIRITQTLKERDELLNSLRQSEERYRSLVENQTDLVCRFIPDGTFVYVNDAYCRFLEKTKDELIGKKWQLLPVRDDLPIVQEKLQKLSPSNPTALIENRILSGKGDAHWIQFLNIGFFDSSGNLQEIQSVGRDISERRRAEESVRESNEKFRSIVDNIGIGVALISPTMEILELNHQMRVWFPDIDPSARSICYRTYNNPPRDEICDYCPTCRTLQDGKVHESRTVTPMATGPRNYRIISSPIFNAQGRVTAAIEMVDDITERLSLENQLQQSQKMEAVGTLAGGIAHDYNNLLAVIMGNLSIAQEEAEPHSAMAELLHEIEQASHKARDLTHQFLTLSQGGYPKKERGSIESLLKAIQGQAQAHEGIEYTLSIQDDLWPVEFDSRQMHDAISNLLINAVEAMPQGGKIAIETENQIIEDRSKDSASPLKEGKYVRISIKDEGGGIPEKHLNRIFDPYFSTKERGVKKGMGLGLAAAYAIVEKHGGHIKVNSTIGVGTTVTIYLPAECAETPGEIGSPLHGAGKAPDAKRDGVGVQSTIANQQSPTQRVLVMDDEESLRNLAQKMLERLGYEVETVKDGSDAIETYKKQMDSGEPFDGVILDLTIKGGMGGAQAIKELIKLDPDVKAIVCSGYFNDPVLANFEEYGFGGALAKPYQKADLESVLKTIL